MNRIKINEEYFQKYEEEFDFNKAEFETKQEIEVRIPITGYYSLKVNCKNPQVAMAEVLKANRYIGVMDIEGCELEVDDVIENETYAIIVQNK